jgi:1-acyl-sn-glycerol-3-phosphate acyltransferase
VNPLRTARALLNSLIFPAWTVMWVSIGVVAVTLTRDRDLFYRWQRHWAKSLFRVCGIELEITGQEHMSVGQPYVIIANHSSYMDVPALFAALPIPPQFIAKRELARIPFLGTALRWGRHILLERGSRASARDSLEQAAAHVRNGAAVLVFPEGTRSTSDEIAQFKTGAFRLAKQGKAAILPVGITGTRHVLPKHGRLLYPHRVRVRIGSPLSASEVSDSDLKTTSKKGRACVGELADMGLAGGSSAPEPAHHESSTPA